MEALEFSNRVISITSTFKSYAINYTKDSDAAQDLIQETIYRALVNRTKYQEGTNLKAWLFTIMKNIFINNYRKKVKKNTIIDTTENEYYINSSSTIVKNEAENNFILKDITKAINSLSDEFKIPFMMHYRGFKYQEIAEELELPLGTVKSRIFFARKDLKQALRIYKDTKR